MAELLQVEGQVRARDADGFSQHARRHAVRTGGDELAHDAQAMLLPKGCEGGNGLPFVPS